MNRTYRAIAGLLITVAGLAGSAAAFAQAYPIEAGEDRRRLRSGGRSGHHRAYRRPEAQRAAQAAVPGGEPPQRRRHHRRGGGRQGPAGRLHPPSHQQRECGQRVAVQEAELRPGQGFRNGLGDRVLRTRHRDEQRVQAEDREGDHRRGKSEPGKAHGRNHRDREHAAPVRGAVQIARGDRPHGRALQGIVRSPDRAQGR